MHFTQGAPVPWSDASPGVSGSEQLFAYAAPGQHYEVVGDDGGPDVGMEVFLAPPVAAVQAKDALEGGDASFDSGAKIPELANTQELFTMSLTRSPAFCEKLRP